VRFWPPTSVPHSPRFLTPRRVKSENTPDDTDWVSLYGLEPQRQAPATTTTMDSQDLYPRRGPSEDPERAIRGRVLESLWSLTALLGHSGGRSDRLTMSLVGLGNGDRKMASSLAQWIAGPLSITGTAGTDVSPSGRLDEQH